MISLRAEITTNRVSIISTSMGFSLFQRVLTGYGTHTDLFSRMEAIFSGNVTVWEESDRYCSVVFRLRRIVLVPVLPHIPKGCRRDFDFTSLIPKFQLTISVCVAEISALYCCNNSKN